MIEQADVLRAAASVMKEQKSLAPAEKFRRAIAAAMSRSNREIPHYYLETEIDMTQSATLADGSECTAFIEGTAAPGGAVAQSSRARVARCSRIEWLLDQQ